MITDGDGQLFYNGSDFVRGAIAYVEPLDTMGAGDSYLAACVRELVHSGWQKGQVLSVSQMQKAMEAGSVMRRKTVCAQEVMAIHVK